MNKELLANNHAVFASSKYWEGSTKDAIDKGPS